MVHTVTLGHAGRHFKDFTKEEARPERKDLPSFPCSPRAAVKRRTLRLGDEANQRLRRPRCRELCERPSSLRPSSAISPPILKPCP
jgi:hypothetical protein